MFSRVTVEFENLKPEVVSKARGHQNSKNNTGSNFSFKVWLTPPLSNYLKRLFQAKNGNSLYLYYYILSTRQLGGQLYLHYTAHLG